MIILMRDRKESIGNMANMAQAIRMALHYGEENLGITDIFGEDAGPPLGLSLIHI